MVRHNHGATTQLELFVELHSTQLSIHGRKQKKKRGKFQKKFRYLHTLFFVRDKILFIYMNLNQSKANLEMK